MTAPNDPRTSSSVVSDDQMSPTVSPRAFSQGVGLVLQTVGFVMFLSSCCICSIAGLWDPQLTRGEVIDQLEQQQTIGVNVATLWNEPAKAGKMLLVMFVTVGGLSLAVFGLGLQSEKPRSGWGALITCVVMLIVLVLAGAGLWLGDGGIFDRAWHTMLVLVMILLTGLSAAALRQMQRHPPPADLHVLPKDYVIPERHRH